MRTWKRPWSRTLAMIRKVLLSATWVMTSFFAQVGSAAPDHLTTGGLPGQNPRPLPARTFRWQAVLRLEIFKFQ
jgi:hypothetical protein